jgi:hypothetical protein
LVSKILKTGVKEAISKCNEAGIRIMITGDDENCSLPLQKIGCKRNPAIEGMSFTDVDNELGCPIKKEIIFQDDT